MRRLWLSRSEQSYHLINMKTLTVVTLVLAAALALAAFGTQAHAASLRAATLDGSGDYTTLRFSFDTLPRYEARLSGDRTRLELVLFGTKAISNLALPQAAYPIRSIAPYQGAENYAVTITLAGKWPYLVRREGAVLAVSFPKAFTERIELPLVPGVTATCEASSNGSSYREVYYTRIPPDVLLTRASMALTSKHGARSMVLTELARLEWAALVVNTAYFDTKSGTPVSLVVSGGKLATLPSKPGRAALVVDDSGRPRIYRPGLEVWLEADGKRLRVQGFNQPASPGMVVAYTPAFPAAKLSPDAIYYRLVAMGSLTPLSLAEIQKEGFADSFIAVNLSPEANPMSGAKEVTFKWKLSDPSKSAVNARFAVCAAPMLVQNGAVNITSKEDEVPADIATSVRARTAVGVDKNDMLIIAVVRESKEAGIAGMSLAALAEYMLKLGAVDALNLDGGGSSEFVLNGAPMNVSYGGERKIPVAFVLK